MFLSPLELILSHVSVDMAVVTIHPTMTGTVVEATTVEAATIAGDTITISQVSSRSFWYDRRDIPLCFDSCARKDRICVAFARMGVFK